MIDDKLQEEIVLILKQIRGRAYAIEKNYKGIISDLHRDQIGDMGRAADRALLKISGPHNQIIEPIGFEDPTKIS